LWRCALGPLTSLFRARARRSHPDYTRTVRRATDGDEDEERGRGREFCRRRRRGWEGWRPERGRETDDGTDDETKKAIFLEASQTRVMGALAVLVAEEQAAPAIDDAHERGVSVGVQAFERRVADCAQGGG